MPNIYEYLNYRSFLRVFLRAQKGVNKKYSHRAILNEMGISSSGFLSNVLSGKKNLTNTQIAKLARIIKLTPPMRTYFEYMVYYTQAKSIEEKKDYFNRLASLQKLKMKHIGKNQLSLFSKWHYVFIRELLCFYNFKDDYQALARMLEPSIKPSEAKQAIEDLLEMGLIKRDPNGYFRQTDNIITTGDEVRSMHLADFQLNTMDLGKRALEKIEAKKRDISVVSMTLSPESFGEVKSCIQAFRKQLLEIACNDSSSNRVYQCNIQFFPVTKEGGTYDQES